MSALLTVLIVLPFAGGLAAWAVARRSEAAARWLSLATLAAGFVLVLVLWIAHAHDLRLAAHPGPWLEQVRVSWIGSLGISYYLGLDGLSLIMLGITFVLGILSVLASWRSITERVGFFHFQLLWSVSGLAGVFLALDLFLFYFFFEMMLVPMYFLIAVWGYQRRIYAAIKFFLFTQASGLLMLVAILALYFIHAHQTGVHTFAYTDLLGTRLSSAAGTWIMLGFFAAFAVKLPAVPLHTWLPDAHTQAPTAGSVILAGILIKIGAYGMIRFLVPLTPHAAFTFTSVAMGLAVASILYGALLAYGQTDLKRLVAYTSVSHMGFVLLGIFTWNELALQGAVLEVVCHAFSTGALFMLVGFMQDRMHTRELDEMGGLWDPMPRMGGVAMVFALASLGLPGLGNFVAEFLILVGAWRVSQPATVLAAAGLVFATVYSLWIIQRAFHGPNQHSWRLADVTPREIGTFGVMIATLVWLGVYPQPLLSTFRQTYGQLHRQADRAVAAAHTVRLAAASRSEAAGGGARQPAVPPGETSSRGTEQ
jgi:NADH-quinone oxidoreductase subunit M